MWVNVWPLGMVESFYGIFDSRRRESVWLGIVQAVISC